MAFSLIGTPVSARSATSPATTPTYDTTGADLLVAIVAHNTAAGGTPAVSDNKTGNTWNALTPYDSGGSLMYIRIYWCSPVDVGSGHTVTFSTGGTFAYASVWFTAWSGAHASPFNKENGATTNATTSLQTGSVTPDQDNSLVIAALSFANITITPTISGGGFSTVEGTTSGSPDNTANRASWAYVVQAAAAASGPTFDWGATSAAAAATIAVFKPFVVPPPDTWLPASFVADGPTDLYIPAGMTPPDKVT
jgi:hypothetical protein